MNKISFIFILSILCIYKSLKVTSKKQFKKKLPELKPRLPNTISFYVDKSLLHGSMLKKTIKIVENHICIKFLEQETEVTGAGINFFKTSNYSDIILDKNLSKPTNIYFNNKDLHPNQLKYLYFFTGMALGLIPETTRYDRDKYIEVDEKNITEPYLKYYKKETTKRNYFSSFDYGSVMVPKKTFGSIRYNTYTYKAKYFPNYDYVSGWTYSFAISDYRRLDRMYCKNKCPNLKGCNNRGYPYTRTGCERCECDIHFIRPVCDTYPVHGHIACGIKSFFKSYRKKSYITRKNVNGTCYYRIKSSNGKKVSVTVNSLVSSSPVSDEGLFFGLNIYYRSDWSIKPLILCANTSNVKIPPLNKEVYLVYYSTNSDPPVNFTITYRSI
uniref:Metalloendopeptidase n=1 Tax=Strongyloides venezuelensis TaxID=75913 RepID=A0A0K0FGX7_STRVS